MVERSLSSAQILAHRLRNSAGNAKLRDPKQSAAGEIDERKHNRDAVADQRPRHHARHMYFTILARRHDRCREKREHAADDHPSEPQFDRIRLPDDIEDGPLPSAVSSVALSSSPNLLGVSIVIVADRCLLHDVA